MTTLTSVKLKEKNFVQAISKTSKQILKADWFSSSLKNVENEFCCIGMTDDCVDKGHVIERAGPGCSKLTTSLVNVSLKFQTFISQIHQYFC